MNIKLVSVIVVLVVALTSCASAVGSKDSSGDVGLPNPASAYCEEQGGTVEIREDEDGGQYGVCVFADGSECEEWAFYKGECEPGLGPLPPKDGSPGEATSVVVDELLLNIMESFPIQVSVTVKGNLADGCVVLDEIKTTRDEETFYLKFDTHREGDACTQALVPFEETVKLDVEGLLAGTYTVVAGEVSETFTFDVDNTLDLDNG